MSSEQDQNAAEFIHHHAHAVDYRDEAAFKKLAKVAQWQIMADKGDVGALLQEFRGALPGLINITEFGRYLSEALGTLARSNPQAFSALLHEEIMTAVGILVVRTRLVLDQQVREQYQQRHSGGAWSERLEFQVFTSQMMALHLHVAKLQAIDANTQRLLEQTRKLRLANEKAEAKKNRPRRPARRQRTSTTRPKSAGSSSRIGGEM